MSAAPAAPPSASADARPSGRRPSSGCSLARIGALCLVELQRLRHDRSELYTRAIQPALWLLIFGETFTRLHAIPTGGLPYLDFLAPGILAQSALFISIFYGIQIIWERDAGILAKLLVTPTPRAALIAGKAFAAGVRALSQVVVVLVLSALLGVALTTNPLRLAAAGARGLAGGRVLLLPVDVDRRHRAQARAADGHRPGDHDAAVLRLQRAVPGRADAGLAAGDQPRQPAELRGRRAARPAARHAAAHPRSTSACWRSPRCVGICVAAGLLDRLAR